MMIDLGLRKRTINEKELIGDDLQFDCSSPIDEGKIINTVGVDDDSINFDQKVETLSI